jgi:altronate hydrolase
MSPDEPTRLLQRVLAGVARHPNISGYLLIGLGCEVNQVQSIVKEYKLDQIKPGELSPALMTIQSAGGVSKTVEAGVAAVIKLL